MMANRKRVNGKTPNGGAYSEIIFFDENGTIVDESKATKCVIRECKSNGDLECETWATANAQ